MMFGMNRNAGRSVMLLAALMLMLAGRASIAMERLLTIDAATTFPTYNGRIGSQGFGGAYSIGEGTILMQQARYELAMGSDVFKFSLSTSIYPDIVRPPQANTLAKIAQLPGYKEVFDLPFEYICLWAYAFGQPDHPYQNGMSQQEKNREYAQVYELARWFLDTYEGTGRSLLIGHWEGDWSLLGSYDYWGTPTSMAIQGMIDWYAVRQKAVEDARNALPARKNVHVYHYAEINLLQKSIEHPGDPQYATLTTAVLPHVTVDAVSYSAYDALNHVAQLPQRALTHFDFVEQHAQFTDAWPFRKKVFVGEYGWNSADHTYNRNQIRPMLKAAGQWGCPLIIHWAMYGVPGAEGATLITPDGELTPTYEMFKEALTLVHAQKEIVRLYLGRNPDEAAELDGLIADFDDFTPSLLLSRVLDQAEYAERVDDEAYLAALFEQLRLDRVAQALLFQSLLEDLEQGDATRWETLLALLDSAEFRQACPDEEFAEYLHRWLGVAETKEELTARMAEASRSTLWTDALDGAALAERVLDRRLNQQATDESYHAFCPDFRPESKTYVQQWNSGSYN